MLLQRPRRSVLVLVGCLISCASAAAQCGSWDTRFFPQGTNQLHVFSQVVFDDGSGPALFVGGDFTVAGPVSANGIAKWNGSSWSALGLGIEVTTASGLGPYALAVFDDGSGSALYAAGDFAVAGGGPAANIARWDGSQWSALGSGTDGAVYALQVFDDGSGPALYVGGSFANAGGFPASRIAKWDGSSWSSVGGGMDGTVRSLATFDDGSGTALFAGGSFLLAGGIPSNQVAKWNGSTWTSVGSAVLSGSVYALAVHDDGSGPAVYAAGDFNSIGGTAAKQIAKWNGSAWSALGTGVSSTSGSGGGPPASLASFDDGSGPGLFVGGAFNLAGGAPAFHMAKWNGSSWSALSTGVGSTNSSSAECLSVFDEGSGPRLFAGGSFSVAGGIAAQHIARWNGSSWSSLGASAGVGNYVYGLTTYDDGSGPVIVAGGSFFAAGAVVANLIAEWNGTSWSALGSGISPSSGVVSDLTQYDSGSVHRLVIAGSFGSAGGVPGTHDIAAWNGTQWESLGGGIDLGVNALVSHDDGTGPALYAAGFFHAAGGTPANGIAKWNGTNWSALGNGIDGNTIVYCLASFDDGTGRALYVGGNFTSASGVLVNGIARWNGSTWSALGSGVTSSTQTPAVGSLTVFNDGSGPALYASGSFDTAGGVPAAHIAKWNGSSWSPLGGGLDKSALILAFEDGEGPALYATGAITLAGSVPVSHLARWDGSSWSDPGGMDDNGYGLAVFDDGQDGVPDLYVGGVFKTAGGVPSPNFAERHGCAFGAFCFGDGLNPALTGACPCNNFGAAGHGCENSASTGGSILSASGATIPDTIVLTATGELPSSLSIFLQGDINVGSGVVFGDGLRCVGGHLKRLYAKNASAGAVSAPSSFAGEPSLTARSAQLGDPIAHGSTRFYQVYYRDPSPSFCANPPGNSWNVSNGLRIRW